MPYVLLIAFAFVLAMVFKKVPSRQLWVVLAIGGVGATLYFMR